MPNIVAVSDWHAGSIYSPINPDTLIQSADGTVFHPERRTAITEWIWQIHKRMVDKAQTLTSSFTLVHLGDICQGNRFMSELISDNLAHQPELALWTMKPFLDLPNCQRVEIILGTAAHNGGQGALEMITAGLVRAYRPDIEVNIHYHAVYYTDEGTIPWVDAAHHGPHPGMYLHTAGNIARNYLRDNMQAEINKLRIPPKYYLRGHYHERRSVEYEIGDYTSRLINLPSLTGANEYARKAGRSPTGVTVGGCIISDSGVEWVTDSQDIRDRTIIV